MSTYAAQPVEGPVMELPIDIRTALLGMWGRRHIFFAFVLLAVLAGLSGGWLLGKKTYQAETLLLFQTDAGAVETGDVGPVSLETHMNMVKIPINLEEVRDRLELPVAVQTLGAGTEVQIQRSTSLLSIRTRWESAAGAAAIANTLRDVFIERHLTLLYQGERNALGPMLEDAQKRKALIELQMSRLGDFEKSTRKRVGDEQKVPPELEGLGDINIRVERLRDAIYDDQRHRANVADLTRAEIEYEKARKLFEQSLLSQLELDKARTSYERHKALTVDTDQIDAWRTELERLQSVAMPDSNVATSPSAAVLQDMLLKDFYIRLELIELEEKVRVLARRDADAVAILDAIRHRKLPRGSDLAERSRFRIVSPAKVPVFPQSSTRRLFAIGIFALLTLAGLGLVAGLEVLDTRVKSPADAEIKLKLPVLGAVSRAELLGKDRLLNLSGSDTFRAIARRVRLTDSTEGGSLLVTSSESQEDRVEILLHLAAALGRQGERVLIVDTNLTHDAPTESKIPASVTERLLGERACSSGLSEFLDGSARELANVTINTVLPGVDILPKSRGRLEADVFAGSRMKDLLEQASKRYTLTIVDGPALSEGAASELLLTWCSSIIFVEASRSVPSGKIRSGVARVESHRRSVAGVILTQMEDPFRTIV